MTKTDYTNDDKYEMSLSVDDLRLKYKNKDIVYMRIATAVSGDGSKEYWGSITVRNSSNDRYIQLYGNGSIASTGPISAASASFSGSITAASATLNGWVINNNSISFNGTYTDTNNNEIPTLVTISNGTNTNREVLVVRLRESGSYTYPFFIRADGTFHSLNTDINSSGISTSGTISCNALTTTGTISGGSLTTTGAISGGSLTTSGAITCNSLKANVNVNVKHPTNGVCIILNVNNYGNHGLVSQGYYPGDARDMTESDYIEDFQWLLYRDSTGHVTIPRNLTSTGTVKTTQTGNYSFQATTSTSSKVAYNIKNSLREGDLEISSAGNLGIYDTTHNNWVFYSAADGSAIYTPHVVKKTTGGDVTCGEVTTATGLQYRLKNSLRNGAFHLSSSGNLGIYDDTNSHWMIYSTTDGNVYLRAISGNYSTPLISMNNTDGQRATGFKCVSSTQMQVYGQWGTTGTTYAYRNVAVTTSDPLLKDNIKDCVINALEVINKIQLHQFDWLTDGAHWDVGFIAPELYEVDPNLAFEPSGEEGEYWGVQEFYLVGVLTKAVQELSSEITNLKEEIAALKRM